ncbi:MAG TPA: hypothetical protein VFU32_12435 [Ktedonobacterales bacterium]|nr:hypothetical protein [Ktedonobacterales bacterium]
MPARSWRPVGNLSRQGSGGLGDPSADGLVRPPQEAATGPKTAPVQGAFEGLGSGVKERRHA